MLQGMWEVDHSGTSAANRGVTPLQSHARCWVHTTAASSLQPPLTITAHSNYPVSEEKRREEKRKASSSSSPSFLSHGPIMVVSPVLQVSRSPDARRAVSLAPALDRCVAEEGWQVFGSTPQSATFHACSGRAGGPLSRIKGRQGARCTSEIAAAQ